MNKLAERPPDIPPADEQASTSQPVSGGSRLVSRFRSINPVLDRELRQRSRSARSMVIMTIFLFMALGLLYLIYLAETATNNSPNSLANTALNSGAGRTMFEWVLGLEMLVIMFVVPGLSAGAISGERDRQTLIPLQVTLVKPSGIFFGKVGAATAFVSLVVMASVPLLAVCYLVGGVSLKSVVMSVTTMILTGFLLAVIGVAISSIFKRTTVAVLASYGMVLLMSIGTLITWGIFAIAFSILDINAGDSWLFYTPFYLNPFITLSGAGGVIDNSFFEAWPLTGIKTGFAGVGSANNFGTVTAADTPYIPLWIRCLLSQFLLAGLLAIFGLRKLKTPTSMVRG